jgi:hypothetical protein
MIGRILSAILPAGLAALVVGLPLPAQSRTTGQVAAGTRFEAAYHVTDSGLPGPTVLLVAGIHGNEPAGVRAADQIRCWPIRRGKLVVLPRANPPALERARRYTPGTPPVRRDLNRNFPQTDRDKPRGAGAQAIWTLAKRIKPDWLVDLHEGYNYHGKSPNSAGNTIVFFPTPETREAAGLVFDAVNADIRTDARKFLLLRYPIKGCLARAAADRLGARVLIFETSFKEPISRRVRQHRFGPRKSGDRPIRAALYDAAGTNKGPAALEQDLRGAKDVVVHRVGPPELRPETLAQFDVLIMPGGKSRVQCKALGAAGRRAVRGFVRAGGGYVGFCAGAYLATLGAKNFLGILDARLLDVRHRLRGHGTVKIELTPAGRKILGERTGLIEIRYANGPLLTPARRSTLPDFETLAVYRSEVVGNGADKGVMKNTPAVAAGRFGEGRVVCFGSHPEYTPGLEPFVHRAVRFAAGR